MAAQATAATGQNVVMWAGDQIDIRVPIRGSSGEPVALPGAAGHYYIERNGDVVLHKSGAGVTIENDAGLFTLVIALDRSDTESFSGRYDHRFRIVDGDNRLITVAVGTLQVQASPAL